MEVFNGALAVSKIVENGYILLFGEKGKANGWPAVLVDRGKGSVKVLQCSPCICNLGDLLFKTLLTVVEEPAVSSQTESNT